MFAARTGVIASTRLTPPVSSTGYYRAITLDQPASDLTNFPVLISGTYSYLATVANAGKVSDANGYDITFYSDSSLTTLLDFERVFWDDTTGEVEFWVRVPTLTSASATVIYMAYGNSSITTDQSNATGTWNSSYKAVYHFADGSTLNVGDATGANNGTNTNATATVGQIDGGAHFAANAGISNNVNFNTVGQPFTLSCWINPSGTTGTRTIWAANTASIGGLQWRVIAPSNTLQLLKQSSSVEFTTTLTVPASTWSYLVLTIDASNNAKIYLDNNSAESQTKSAGLFASFTSIIGRHGTGAELFNGDLDEIRVLNVQLSADWIAAEYSNQNDPANFYSIGAELP